MGMDIVDEEVDTIETTEMLVQIGMDMLDN